MNRILKVFVTEAE
jgi:hypothetical protein